MNENQSNAKNLINELLQEAKKKTDFEQWKKDHPEPEQELTTEEAETLYNNMTDEELKDFIEHCVFCEGFEKVVNEVQAGQYKEEIDRITKYFCIPDKSVKSYFAMFYAAGVNHGFELACKIVGADNKTSPF